MSYKDKEKQREYKRGWLLKQRAENTPYIQRQRVNRKRHKYNAKDREWRRKQRAEIWLYVAEWRETHRTCSCCSDDFPLNYLELHHPNGDGKGTLSKYASSLSRIECEIERCLLLCRKCHKAVHKGMRKDSTAVMA